MTKAEKIRSYINGTKMLNVSEICNKCKIDRLKMHRFLEYPKMEYQLTETQIDEAFLLLKKFGLK